VACHRYDCASVRRSPTVGVLCCRPPLFLSHGGAV
jgi:hypothetical protein